MNVFTLTQARGGAALFLRSMHVFADMCSGSLFREIDLCSTSDQLRARVASLTTTSRYLAMITHA